VRQTSAEGREQVLLIEGPGATLGEVSCFDRGRYVASAVTRLLFLRRPARLLEFCRRRPVAALAFLESLARRVRRFAELVGDLAFREVTQRVVRHLETAAGAEGPAIATGTMFELALTQEQLAARLGTVRQLRRPDAGPAPAERDHRAARPPRHRPRSDPSRGAGAERRPAGAAGLTASRT